MIQLACGWLPVVTYHAFNNIFFRLSIQYQCSPIPSFLPEFLMFNTNFLQIPRLVNLNVGKQLNDQINTFFADRIACENSVKSRVDLLENLKMRTTYVQYTVLLHQIISKTLLTFEKLYWNVKACSTFERIILADNDGVNTCIKTCTCIIPHKPGEDEASRQANW